MLEFVAEAVVAGVAGQDDFLGAGGEVFRGN